MESDAKPFKTARILLSVFDIILALTIIICSSTLLKNPIGGVYLIFGLVMLTIVTTLRIFEHW